MIFRFTRITVAALSLLLVLTFYGCKTAPEEPEETTQPQQQVEKEEPQKEETAVPEEKPEPVKPEPLSQEEIDAAYAALQRANLIGANKYYPEEYRTLAEELNSSVKSGEEDPDKARQQLKDIIIKADALYDKTLLTRADEYENKYFRADKKLLAIEADKFAPEEYKNIQESALATLALYNEGKLAEAQKKADETLEAQQRLYYNLNENIRYVGILKRDTENYLSDAEDNEAFIYSPEELESANNYYFDGISSFRSYDIHTSVKQLTEAKRYAVLAARTSAVRKKQAETDALMLETQKELEEASRLKVLNPDGTVSQAQPWDGETFLESNPLIDHSEDVEPVEIEEPRLKNLDAPVNAAETVPEDVPIEEEGTQVNADTQNADYLILAKTLWEKGVQARNSGNFDLAQDYFKQAQTYIDIYEANAVLKTYTVVYRKVKTDCLWRIAERDDIFGNPYLWPKIWRANRKIIQNPDLIYPGQILAIPPE